MEGEVGISDTERLDVDLSEDDCHEVRSLLDNTAGESDVQFKVYKRRWVILLLYAAYDVLSAFQWIQYSIIANVIVHYYNVPFLAVNCTAAIFSLAFVITIFPATWFFNKVGLRLSLLLAMGGTCLGAWIKVFSVAPDRFWVSFLGQAIVAVSQTYVLSIPVPLAATWFGPKEVSTACSLGLLGPQIGCAIGFVVPVLLVPDNGDIVAIERGLNYLFYGCAIACSTVFILQLLFLQSAPPTPPSYAQANRDLREESVMEYIKSLWGLMKNINFVLIFVAYSINLSVISALVTFLNQMIIPIYPDAQNDAGNIGLLITLSGIAAAVIAGYLLDLTRLYKEMNVVAYTLSAGTLVALTFILRIGNLTYLYIMSGIFGFFMIACLPTSFEFAAELTYPEPEANITGVLTFGSQILTVFYTLAYSWIFTPYGDLPSNLFLSGSLILAAILSLFAKSDLRRQRAGQDRTIN